jgi:hypothetical protein
LFGEGKIAGGALDFFKSCEAVNINRDVERCFSCISCFFEKFEIGNFDAANCFYAAMKTKEIIEVIKEQEVAEEVWLALTLAKLRSVIEHKTGVNFLNTGGLPPQLVSQAMNLCVVEFAEEIIKRNKARN